MSFTRKIAKKRSSDLVEEVNKVFNSVYPTRIENISCNAAVEKQECFDNWDYKDKDDKDKLVCNFISAFKTIKIPLQKVAFKLDISASSGGNPESAG